VTGLQGFSDLKVHFDEFLRSRPNRDGRRNFAARWVREGVANWVQLKDSPAARPNAFSFITLDKPSTPNLEVLAALAELRADYPIEDTITAITELATSSIIPLNDEERTALWTLVRDYLAQGRNITFSMQTAVLRGGRRFLSAPTDQHIPTEVESAIDAMLMLPTSTAKRSIFRQFAAWDPTDSTTHISKFLLREIVDQPSHYNSIVALNKDLFELVIGQKNQRTQLLLQNIAYVLRISGASSASTTSLLASLKLSRQDLSSIPSPIIDGTRTAEDDRAASALRDALASRMQS